MRGGKDDDNESQQNEHEKRNEFRDLFKKNALRYVGDRLGLNGGRRIVFVKLTPEGESVFDRVYPAHRQRIRQAMMPLGDQECGELIRLLSNLYDDEEGLPCAVDMESDIPLTI